MSNALAALEALQVAEGIRAHGTMTGGGGLRTRRGRWLMRMPGMQPGGQPVSLLMVHRAELHRELLRALPDGAVRTGVTVTRVDPAPPPALPGLSVPTRTARTALRTATSLSLRTVCAAGFGRRSGRMRPDPATPGSRPGGA